jgi:hypothetical protein
MNISCPFFPKGGLPWVAIGIDNGLDRLPAWAPPRRALLIRRLRTSQWDAESWPIAKRELWRALKLRHELSRGPWWN